MNFCTTIDSPLTLSFSPTTDFTPCRTSSWTRVGVCISCEARCGGFVGDTSQVHNPCGFGQHAAYGCHKMFVPTAGDHHLSTALARLRLRDGGGGSAAPALSTPLRGQGRASGYILSAAKKHVDKYHCAGSSCGGMQQTCPIDAQQIRIQQPKHAQIERACRGRVVRVCGVTRPSTGSRSGSRAVRRVTHRLACRISFRFRLARVLTRRVRVCAPSCEPHHPGETHLSRVKAGVDGSGVRTTRGITTYVASPVSCCLVWRGAIKRRRIVSAGVPCLSSSVVDIGPPRSCVARLRPKLLDN
jgi:hypothetical protein